LVEQFASHAANQARMLPWAHLRRKFRQLWVQSCPSEAARVFPAAASKITPAPSMLVSASLKIAVDRPPSTSTPLPVVPGLSTIAGSRCSFTDVVGMSGPPQRPPPPGAFAMGHVRPPLRQPPPVTQGAGGAGPSAGVAGALPSFGSIGGAPLHPPSRSWGRRLSCLRSTCPMFSTRRSSSSKQCCSSHMFNKGSSSCLFLLPKLSRCLPRRCNRG
jgi:hypothetical protein